MPITVESSVSAPYYPNGVTTAFPFDFKAASATEVIAVDEDGATISTALYSVTLDADEGGSLNFTVAPELADYAEIYVVSDPALTQPADFDNTGPSFNPAALTRALDRAALRDLKQQRELDRALKVPFGETAPSAASFADSEGKVLGIVDGVLIPVENTAAAAASSAADAENSSIEASASYSGSVAAAALAATYRDQVAAEVGAAETAAASAEADADRAEDARDAATLAGALYPDTATGLAAVVDGAYFTVAGSAGVFAYLYRRDAGPVATLIAEYPSLASLGGSTATPIDKQETATTNTTGTAKEYIGTVLPQDWLEPEDMITELRWTGRIANASAGITAVLEFFDRPDDVDGAQTTRPGDHGDDVAHTPIEYPIATVGLTADNVTRELTWALPTLKSRKAGHLLCLRWSVKTAGAVLVAIGAGSYTDTALDSGPGAFMFKTAANWATSNDLGMAITIDTFVSPTQAADVFGVHTERLGYLDDEVAGALEAAAVADAKAEAIGDALTEVTAVIADAALTGVYSAASVMADEWTAVIPVGTQTGAIAPGRQMTRFESTVALQAGAVLTRSIYKRKTNVSWFADGADPARDTLLVSDTSTIGALGLVADELQQIGLDCDYTAKSGEALVVHFVSVDGGATPLDMGVGYADNPEGLLEPYVGYRKNNAVSAAWFDNPLRLQYEIVGIGYEVPSSSGGGGGEVVTARQDTVALVADIHLKPATGQSPSIGSDAKPLLASTTTFGGLMFNNGERTWTGADTAAVRHGSLVALAPSVDGDYGDCGFTGADQYQGALYATEGETTASRGFVNLFAAVGQGGQALPEVSEGGAFWERMTDAVSYAVTRAKELDQIVAIASVRTKHGEAAINSNTDDAYINQARTFCADIDTLPSYTGQAGTIPVLATQVASHNWYEERLPKVANAQLKAHVEGFGYYITTPTYMFDYAGVGASQPGIHPTAKTQRISAAYDDLAEWHLRVLGQPWACLRATSTMRQGKVILREYNAALTLDDVTVDDPGDYGFSVTKSDGTAVALSSVAIENETRLRIVCATDPGPLARLYYGGVTQAMIDSGAVLIAAGSGAGRTDGIWTGPRGCLRDSFGDGFPHYIDSVAGIDWTMHRWAPFEIATLR